MIGIFIKNMTLNIYDKIKLKKFKNL